MQRVQPLGYMQYMRVFEVLYILLNEFEVCKYICIYIYIYTYIHE
jgi:hypothetical protein